MALINCPDCYSQVSNHANVCPKCGCPIKDEIAIKLVEPARELEFFSPQEAKALKSKVIQNETSIIKTKDIIESDKITPKKQSEFNRIIVKISLLIIGIATLYYFFMK